jgi:hypothetical protein
MSTMDGDVAGLKLYEVAHADFDDSTKTRVLEPALYRYWLREDKKLVAEWDIPIESGNDDHYHYRLYSTSAGLFLEREWRPARPQDWRDWSVFYVMTPDERLDVTVIRPPMYFVPRDGLEEAVDCLLRHSAERVVVRRSGTGYVVAPSRAVDGCALREAV